MNCGKVAYPTSGTRALSEIEVVQTEDSAVRSKAKFVRSHCPGQVVVDEKARGAAPLDPGIVQTAQVVNGAFAPLPSSTIGNAASVFSKVGGTEEALIPGERRIKVIHQVL